MTASRVGVTAGLCDLITGMTSGAGCATLGPNLASELEKLFVYSLIWSVGGLLEFEDRSVAKHVSRNSWVGRPKLNVHVKNTRVESSFGSLLSSESGCRISFVCICTD